MINNLPKLLLIRQKFHTTRLDNIPDKLRTELLRIEISRKIKKDKRIAITVGSRGIANLRLIVKTLVEILKEFGAKPFIVPSMGSHGGGTAEGQIAILRSFGITESNVGCSIHSSMETVEFGKTPDDVPLLMDKFAYESDGVIILNRIKPHTTLSGSIESGLMKMCLIGLGNERGARTYHRAVSRYGWDNVVSSAGKMILDKAPVLFGIAILENPLEESADIKAVPTDKFLKIEPKLLAESRELIASLPFDYADLLIVDEMGKDISGTGMDAYVTQRKEGMRQTISKIFVRDLSSNTYGNANGIGLADFTTHKLFKKIDFNALYTNSKTACRTDSCKIPMMLDTDKDTINTALDILGIEKFDKAKIMWIQNTLKLEKIYMSEAYKKEVKSRKNLSIIKENVNIEFDNNNMLLTKDFI